MNRQNDIDHLLKDIDFEGEWDPSMLIENELASSRAHVKMLETAIPWLVIGAWTIGIALGIWVQRAWG